TETLTTLNNLAVAYSADHRLPDAIKLLEEILEIRLRKSGPDHPETFTVILNLVSAYTDADRLPEAIKLIEQRRDYHVSKFGVDDPRTLTTLYILALVYQRDKRLPEALPLFEKAAGGMAKLKFQHPNAPNIISNTVQAYVDAKQFDKAVEWQRKWMAFVKE